MAKEIEQKDILKKGYALHDYRIESVLGRGAFGITYKAYDEKNNVTVAIKEFFYSNFVVRENNSTVIPISSAKDKQDEYEEFLQKFQDEAETISKLNHINIVKVSDFFRANNTAYFVMSYDEGETLGDKFEKIEKFDHEEDILEIIIPVLEGLKIVHKEGFLHRDLKPDNIYLRDGGLPMLLDFGAARFAIGKETKSLTAIATPGYAPPEQYSEYSKQSASTDLYAIGAILYKMITGVKPPDANHRQTERLNDNLDPIKKLSVTHKGMYSKDFLQAVDSSLELKPKDRPQNIEEFQQILLYNYYKKLEEGELAPEEDNFSLIKKYWYIWTIVGLLIFVVVFLIMKNDLKEQNVESSLSFQTQEVIQSEPMQQAVKQIEKPKYVPPVIHYYSLAINTVPSSAIVKIMNIKEKYYDGIELPNGRYDIVVSNDGYEDKSFTVQIRSQSKTKKVTLNKVPVVEKKQTPVISPVTIKKEVSSTPKQNATPSFSEVKRQQERCQRVERKIASLKSDISRLKSKNNRITNKLDIELAQKKRAMENAKGYSNYNDAVEVYNNFVAKYKGITSQNFAYVNKKVNEFNRENRRYNNMSCVR